MSRILSAFVFLFLFILIPTVLLAGTKVKEYGFGCNPQKAVKIMYFAERGSFICVYNNYDSTTSIFEYDLKKAQTQAYQELFHGNLNSEGLYSQEIHLTENGYVYLFLRESLGGANKLRLNIFNLNTKQMTKVGYIPGGGMTAFAGSVLLDSNRLLFYGGDIMQNGDYKAVYFLDINAAIQQGVGFDKVGELPRPVSATKLSYYNKTDKSFFLLGSISPGSYNTEIDKCVIQQTQVSCEATGHHMTNIDLVKNLNPTTSAGAYSDKESRYYFTYRNGKGSSDLFTFTETAGVKHEIAHLVYTYKILFSEKLGGNGGMSLGLTRQPDMGIIQFSYQP